MTGRQKEVKRHLTSEQLDEAIDEAQQYELGLPDQDAREAIFRLQLQDIPTEISEAEIERLAEQSEGLSSADIVGIVEDASMRAAERDADAITAAELFDSFPE